MAGFFFYLKDGKKSIYVVDIAFKHQPKETGEVFCVKEEQYTAVEFLAFLAKIVAHYPNVRKAENIRRNDLCPCGSGKEFKNCHGIAQ